MIRGISRLDALMSLRMSLGEAAPNEHLKPTVKARRILKKWEMPCLFRKVGARRTAELCFPTPPSEPGMRLSPHPALQGLTFRP